MSLKKMNLDELRCSEDMSKLYFDLKDFEGDLFNEKDYFDKESFLGDVDNLRFSVSGDFKYYSNDSNFKLYIIGDEIRMESNNKVIGFWKIYDLK